MINQNIFFEYLSQRPKQLYVLTGLTPQQLECLTDEFNDEWERVKLGRRKQLNRQRKIGGGRKLALPKLEDRIILFAFYAKHYASYSLIEMFFGVSRAATCRTIREMTKVLGKRMMIDKDKRKIMSPDELFYVYPELKKILVDATEQRINKIDSDFYSGKEGEETVKTQIITDTKGRILFTDDYSPGRKHDSNYLRNSRTGDFLRKGPPLMVVADSGYQGMNKVFTKTPFFTPEKRDKNKKKLNLEEKTWNKKLSQERIVVEHGFGKLKQFKILAEAYRNSIDIYSETFRAVANIVNLRMATN